jgi:hypothetical protein
MPCNGHGHPPNCDCGWGGVFYDSAGIGYSPQHWQRPESHTHPNARCQHCGQKVFFYRSPNGGSVFFDELGSPWPKHNCVGTRTQRFDVQAQSTPGSKRRQWSFLWKEKWPLPENEGTLLIDTQDRPLFVKARFSSIPLWTPIWISKRPNGTGRYSISLPQYRAGKVTEKIFNAFTLKSLTSLDNAKYFKGTIREINKGLPKDKFSGASTPY